MELLETKFRKELTELVRSGMTGSRGSFALSVGKFISKVKTVDLELAKELSRFLTNQAILRGNDQFVAAPVDADSRMELVERTYPVVLSQLPVLPEEIKGELDDVLLEWASAEVLLQEGLAPARMLLFCGAPGVGKTLAAHWLAQQLDLPLLTLNLATVMSSFLGKTGNNIRAVFEHAAQAPCVLLLDEFDAIAKRRDDESDVGELKRLVNVLLQSLDEWPVNSLLIAATNHGDLLDPAVWRRFDHVLTFKKPDAALIARYLADVPMTDGARENLARLLQGESFSAIQQLLHAARKAALLGKVDFVQALVRLSVRLRLSRGDMAKPVEGEMLLMYLDGHSLREVGARFGKSHPTVGKIIKQYLGD
ncbi:AAA family ATPase [Massilia eurypsychrophila]|uniref:AAA family ATPase n=1 Tax=Massilia eurypsychrophila TaxID=1485217 RepID=A0A2G8T8Q7_9BURK|nr:AAA family ATPase [Massilia eurypsychrophila]PIL42048.1 AAA family ATPase [Massilia eurypsychrophila]